jgi:hypothetical protein
MDRGILISAVPIKTRDGGGWASRRIFETISIGAIQVRSKKKLVKVIYAVFGFMLIPFLHPVFTRYIPCNIFFNLNKIIYLNFSQTFSIALFSNQCVVICHDLQCHRDIFFKVWIRWSEKYILNRAKHVCVLSTRDAKIVNRYYGVPSSRINNLSFILLKNINEFQVEFDGPIKNVFFLGSLERKENYEGVLWFVQNVLIYCPFLSVKIIGSIEGNCKVNHPQLEYLGFVDDLSSAIPLDWLMIAPMFSAAGVKIKVIESLERKIAVMGTRQAFSGMPYKPNEFCSNDPVVWIKTLSIGGVFYNRILSSKV